MTCKDCIYYEVCADFRRNICDTDRKRFEEYRLNSDGLCDNFKDKNAVIVPPCKVGDWVYVDVDTFVPMFIYYENEFIYSKYFVIGEIVSIVKTKKQLLMKIRVLTKNHRQYAQKRYTVNAIGKTIFFTREGAIKALSEKE